MFLEKAIWQAEVTLQFLHDLREIFSLKDWKFIFIIFKISVHMNIGFLNPNIFIKRYECVSAAKYKAMSRQAAE